MANEEHRQRDNENAEEEKKWPGSVRKGVFWCDCEPPRQARVYTTKKGPNKGKRFWKCSRTIDDPERCDFFIWAEQQAEAKEWLKNHGREEAPETPPKAPKSPETPWTKAKRKPVSREVSDENENGGPSKRKSDDERVLDGEAEAGESFSRKATKTNEAATPGGQTFLEKLKKAALPTPETLDKGKGKAVEESPLETKSSGVANAAKDDNNVAGNPQETADLTARVLKLLRSENHDLKGSTELLIRHEIEGELDLNAAKVKNYERTISRMSKRIDELEGNIADWIGSDVLVE